MSDGVGGVGGATVQRVGGPTGAARPTGTPPASVLPAPTQEIGAASADVTALLYALTARQRDRDTSQRASTAERKDTERKDAFEKMRKELEKAKEAEEDGSWLGDVLDVVDSVTGALVGGNPLQDLAHDLSEATGIGAFEVAYDFLRPDALLHGAAVLTSAATGCDDVKQVYDVGADDVSMKTRFQGAADVTGEAKVMDAYAFTRDATATAMVTVGTCGTGTVAVVAMVSSAALMAEAKLDVLGRLGVEGEAKMWTRLGAQAAVAIGSAGLAFATKTQFAKGGADAAVKIIGGANQVTRGAAKVGQALYQREVSEHMTNAAAHQHAQHRVDREQERLISGLREVTKSYQRCLESIGGALNERDQTHLMLARQIA